MSTLLAPTNRAAVLHAPEDLRFEQVPFPECRDEEVIVRVESVGVCGSDTHYLTHGRVGRFVVSAPMILGHEAAGEIVAIGANVDRSRTPVGTRVAVEPGVPCRRCGLCQSARYNLCPDMRFMATPPVDGALAQYIAIPQQNVFPLPDTMSFDDGALCEPLSVALWALGLARQTETDRVLITGAGPVGLLVAEAAQARGAAAITVTDIAQARLDLAADHGFSIRNVAEDPLPLDSEDFDVLIECSGAPGALTSGMWNLARGGRATMVGVPNSPTINVPLPALHDREISVTANFRYANTWPTAIALIGDSRINLEGIVTEHYSLLESEAALTAGLRDPGCIKAMIHPQA